MSRKLGTVACGMMLDKAMDKIQLKSLAEEMQAVSKGLEKVEQELTASDNDGAISSGFQKMFKDLRDENQQQADAERRKLEKEALKEQAAASSSGKKEVDADRIKLNFLNQLHAV
ncbi:hypothetical protein RND71_012622 [Anisodus tanguticus]|uniref:Uncharacterized protein n=1 Tax=Anisodus tanguticus TaxID=243964 RepID=A0AAE1VQV7_9SOLA|nr:hypothetical protein RND71_012622 [Anisodus tanguticus]